LVDETGEPYSYAGDDPIVWTDPSGQLFGADTLLGAAVGGIVGTVAGGGSYLVAVTDGQQQFSWAGFEGATAGGLVGGAAAGACEGTTWVALASCGALGGVTATFVNDLITGTPVTPADALESGAFGGVGGVVGGRLFPLRGFKPYKLSNVWNPGPNTLRLYQQEVTSGAIGLYQGLFNQILVC
jgi:hypothetical protein